MAASRPRPLPGVRFEAQTPPLDDVLPRMDVAVFVGFAARGPVHLPVPVEDAAAFAAVFGDDPVLAWDADRGRDVAAYLGPAVRDFFRNGGRRCWVIRAAGDARSHTFTIPGLYERVGERFVPATMRAASPGSWAGAVRAGAALETQLVASAPMPANAVWSGALSVAPTSGIVAGDLLRLTFAGAPERGALLAVARSIGFVDRTDQPLRRAMLVETGDALWVRPAEPRDGRAPLPLTWTAADGGDRTADASAVAIGAAGAATMTLPVALADAPRAGTVVRFAAGDGVDGWFTVEQTARAAEAGSPPADGVVLAGRAVVAAAEPPQGLPAAPSAVERLRLELWVREGSDPVRRLGGLGFASGHPRFWGALPDDATLFASRPDPGEPVPPAERWADALRPRFPLAAMPAPADAAGDASARSSFPVGMPPALAPDALLPPRPVSRDFARSMDGLQRFEAALFLDPGLRETGTEALLAEADYLRYQAPVPRPLAGIHAALALDEATIIAVPDALHTGWDLDDGMHDAGPPAAEQAPTDHAWEAFAPCGISEIAPPVLVLDGPPTDDGVVALRWVGGGDRTVVEESPGNAFVDPVTVYDGAAGTVTLVGRAPGTYVYRARTVRGGQASAWSAPIGAVVTPLPAMRYRPSGAFDRAQLLAVHAAVLRLCAARGDLFGVLGLPGHAREDEALEIVQQLRGAIDGNGPATARDGRLFADVGPRGLSFGAVYHPWFAGGAASPIGPAMTPPDGAVCGVIARRAIGRGAWIAPANEPIDGVVALTPPIARARWQELQDAQINVLRQDPRGFLVFSADTLSDDPELRPINVRRLLMLLRRLALRRGTALAFEPNDDAFRRLVQRDFAALLGDLFARGAFAGSTPASAFMVVTDASVNTRQSVDQGRFIVELRVAPSLPMRFLAVRLLHAPDRALSLVEV